MSLGRGVPRGAQRIHMRNCSKLLRVSFFTYAAFPKIGGVEKHLQCLCRELDGADSVAQVNVFTVLGGGGPSTHAQKLSVYNLFNITNIKNKLLRKLVAHVAVLVYMPRLLRSDVIHFHDYSVYRDYFYLYRFFFAKRRLFMTFHGFEGLCPPNEKIVKVRQKIETHMCATIEVGDFISKWYGTHPTKVIYGGVDLVKQHGSPERQDAVVFIGRIATDANVTGYIDALAALQDKHSIRLPFDLYGVGDQIDDVLEYAKAKQVAAKYKGALKDASQSVYMRYKYAFCSGYLSLLEAAASHCHIFCYYDNELKRDYFTFGNFPFKSCITATDNPRHIAKALCEAHAGVRQDELQSCYAKARELSWQSVAKTYEDLWLHK